MFFVPLFYAVLKNKYLFKCDYQKMPICGAFLAFYSSIHYNFSHFKAVFMQSPIDIYIIWAYTIDKKRGKKRGKRKTRKRTNGDKKDGQAATTSTLKTEYSRIAPLVDNVNGEKGKPIYDRQGADVPRVNR